MSALMGAMKWRRGMIPKASAMAILTFLGSKWGADIYWNQINRLPKNSLAKKFAGRYTPHHYHMGTALITTGIISEIGGEDKWYAPMAIGAGTGLIASDVTDFIKQEDIPFVARDLSEHYHLGKLNKELNMVEMNIPDWLPREYKYHLIARMLRQIVTKPTYNKKLKRYIPGGKYHPDVILKARQIVRGYGVDGRDTPAVLRAIQIWMQKNITYVYDPKWVETFIHPYQLLRIRAGDCDCQVTLAASLGEALGIQMKMVMVAQRNPEVYNHILAAGVLRDGRLCPIETIEKGYPLGKWPRNLRKGVINL